ncbi:MAG: hypothetical protein ABSG14_13220 [Verrucomicrobiia bacterium]
MRIIGGVAAVLIILAGCQTTAIKSVNVHGATAARKRVLVIVNKWWECDPLMEVLLNDNARPASYLGWPTQLNHPRKRPDQNNLPPENPSPIPRAVFTLTNISVEVWCLSDLLEDLPDKPQFQSSSEVKARRLSKAFAGRPVDFVVAVGAAGYPGDASENGSVVVGTKVFMHNCHPGGANSNSNWNVGPFDKIVPTTLDSNAFTSITMIETSANPSVKARFLVPPLNPAPTGRLLADQDFVAIGEFNVTDYSEYDKTDQQTLDAYRSSNDPNLGKSLETTHGLIRSQSEAPFIFVSGIYDRVGHFEEEVSPRLYSQKTTAAHNAGVVVAWMLPKIDVMFGSRQNASATNENAK